MDIAPATQPFTPRRFASFDEFFDFYLQEHAEPNTRRLHFLGTTAAAILAVAALTDRRRRWLLLPAIIAGYAPAWFAHFAIERNRPATFRNPLWSARADLRMLRLWLTGRLEPPRARAPGPVARG
jgi:hypothetical protein